MIFEGENGFSEWSPFPEYTTKEASRWLKASLEWLEKPRPEIKTQSITPNATLPAVELDKIESILSGFEHTKTIKIKIAEPGEPRTLDLQRIQKTTELYPESKIRLDANGAMTIEQSMELVYWLKQQQVNLEYLEQPVASIEEMTQLRAEIQARDLEVLIAADESIRKHTDPFEVDSKEAADVMVVKWQPLGGIAEITDIAEKVSIPLVVSSALESAIGLNAGIWLACSLNSGFDPGLATSSLFVEDLVDQLPMEAVEIEPDRSRLDKYAADSETSERWRQRLKNAYQELYSPE